jgi:outer membrane protein assembly factor BamD (BamD/ComL family)
MYTADEKASELYENGMVLYRRGKYKEAIKSLDRAVRQKTRLCECMEQ